MIPILEPRHDNRTIRWHRSRRVCNAGLNETDTPAGVIKRWSFFTLVLIDVRETDDDRRDSLVEADVVFRLTFVADLRKKKKKEKEKEKTEILRKSKFWKFRFSFTAIEGSNEQENQEAIRKR